MHSTLRQELTSQTGLQLCPLESPNLETQRRIEAAKAGGRRKGRKELTILLGWNITCIVFLIKNRKKNQNLTIEEFFCPHYIKKNERAFPNYTFSVF